MIPQNPKGWKSCRYVHVCLCCLFLFPRRNTWNVSPGIQSGGLRRSMAPTRHPRLNHHPLSLLNNPNRAGAEDHIPITSNAKLILVKITPCSSSACETGRQSLIARVPPLPPPHHTRLSGCRKTRYRTWKKTHQLECKHVIPFFSPFFQRTDPTAATSHHRSFSPKRITIEARILFVQTHQGPHGSTDQV